MVPEVLENAPLRIHVKKAAEAAQKSIDGATTAANKTITAQEKTNDLATKAADEEAKFAAENYFLKNFF